MGVAVSVPSSNTKAAVQVPIDQTTDNTIINTGTVNILLCEQNTFGPDATYVLQSGAALPWEHETCWAVVQSGTIQGSLWATTLLFYGTTAPSVVSISAPENIITIVDNTAGTPQLWIPGIAGKSIYVYNLTVSVGIVAGADIYGDLQTTSGYFIAFFSLSALQTYTVTLGGFQIPAGQGLDWYIPGGKVALTLTYSQY
jgi:hypothetical protein